MVPLELEAGLEDALVHQLAVHRAQLTGVEDEAPQRGYLQGEEEMS